MRKKILVIDDDAALGEVLANFLPRFDFDVITANHPTQGLELLKSEKPALVLLDIMLPSKNGFELCSEIRQIAQTPIIILSARGNLDDRVIGLDLGADDYIPKPYEPRELVARIQSVLRRYESAQPAPVTTTIFKSYDLVVDTLKATVTLAGKTLDLTTMEFEILCLFMKNPGVTLSREQVVDKIRGIEWDSIDRTIDVLISRLRNKLKDDAKNPKYLKTIWGSGYRFVGEVTHI
ncbi:MAG: response regulator transcription factor [Bacteriovorax sp.]|jgi:two-component system phosphate regulon response regulator OmpR